MQPAIPEREALPRSPVDANGVDAATATGQPAAPEVVPRDCPDCPEIDPSVLAAIIESTEARRQTTDQMMWQVPVLSLTAQSFLLTIALRPTGEDRLSQVVAASLAVVAALATIQLLTRHRYIESTYSRALQGIELCYGLLPLHDKPMNVAEWASRLVPPKPEKSLGRLRTALRQVVTKPQRVLAGVKSFHVWLTTLVIFGATDVAIAIAAAGGFW